MGYSQTWWAVPSKPDPGLIVISPRTGSVSAATSRLSFTLQSR